MAFDGPLANVGKTFTVVNAQNKEDLMINMPTWDLLNLKVETILDLPDRLNRDYGISSKYLEKVMDEYGIQSLGKDGIEKQFGIEKPAQYMLSSTRHYSWPKGAGTHFHPRFTLFCPSLLTMADIYSHCRYWVSERRQHRSRQWRTSRHIQAQGAT